MARATKGQVVLALSVITLVAVAAVAWFSFRYYGKETVVLSDGTRAQDLSLAEARGFGGSAHSARRVGYLERLQSYREMSADSVTTPSDFGSAPRPHSEVTIDAVAEVIRPAIESVLERAEDDGSDLARRPTRLTTDQRDALVRLAARTVAVLAGLDRAAYEADLPPGAVTSTPTYIPGIVYAAEEFVRDLELPDEQAPSPAWRPVFESLYEYHRSPANADRRVVSVVTDPAGVVALWGVSNEGRSRDLLARNLSEETRSLFFGVANQSVPQFHHSPHDHADVPMLIASVMLIVETTDGDRYPISIHAHYDDETQSWWPTALYRHTSVRAMVSPPAVY